ncbi:MAG: PilN domain-containing protein [Phycisphaerales bacterium]|nr:PilN domain-containing protein [Phycisphaerales bacterium]
MSKLPWHTDESSSSFLPTDYVQRKQEVRFVAITVSLFLIVMLAVVGAFLVTNRRWTSVRQQQQVIATQFEAESSKLDQLKDLEKQREEMLSKAQITTSLLEPAPRSVLLAELVTSLPKETTLLEVKLESKRVKAPPPKAAADSASKAKSKSKAKGKSDAEPPKPVAPPPKFEFTLTITGVAPINNQVADYLKKLHDSPLLKDVELLYIEEAKIDDLELRRFQIQAHLPDNADARKVDDAEEFDLDMASVSDKEDGR